MAKGKGTTRTPDQIAKAKQEKFVEIANKRVPKAIKSLKLLRNLGGSGYKSTEAQQKAICAALRAEVDSVEAILKGAKQEEAGFKL